ncbi:hypothetical protein OG205_34680 [Lentzea sp. NBC_00516]|uniref:NACHT domain-containing protein n=1 Tax=Lentzea sp. NBC_00516 TaxID=2903582 RepID=UPI002E80B387|nr:hypothetical protein [Lentzea sp. NBC_00516]WUD23174.1 hypothetical protein OG205_34680 [Lentzea sp. NBC_00516]
MDYDLTRLGTREFEHLIQALAKKVLGSGVSIFGDGRDGKREATFRGAVGYPNLSPASNWNGYGVVQAKFRQRQDVATNAGWLVSQIKAEFEGWRAAKRKNPGLELPEYILICSNVVLSAVQDSGGIDVVKAEVAKLAKSFELKGWDLWHYDEICRFLDDSADIRRAYAAFITPGDVLSCIAERFQGATSRISETLAVHAVKMMKGGQDLRLSQTGADTSAQVKLSQIAIDLPLEHVDGEEQSRASGVAALLIEAGNSIRKLSVGRLRNYVIVGGPGQGKTTIGQLLCQLYRVELLDDRPTFKLGLEGGDIHRTLKQDFVRLGLPEITAKRWPMQISLSAYGDAVRGGEDVSLLKYIAEQVSKRTTEPLNAADMKAWLRDWPWILILDGLDEVPAATTRAIIDEKLQDFAVEAADVDADLLMVATTRPQGYSEEFSPQYHQHVYLRALNVDEAVEYATRLAEVTHSGNIDLRQLVIQRVTSAATEHVTARLMRSPLQVTIMSLLFERRAHAPKSRYNLFSLYYDAIYAREVGKPGTTARMLDEQRRYIDQLHENVALELQIRAEHESDAESMLPTADLHAIALQHLVTEGHSEKDAKPLAQRIVESAMHRLVLLVPARGDTVGFEVRSLQEFMAARAITRGRDEAIAQRMRTIAPSAHWRNTWLLAVGRVFVEADHFRGEVIAMLAELDRATPTMSILLPGARLAVDLLDDDVAANQPGYQCLLVERALATLQFGLGGRAMHLADVLAPLAIASTQVREIVFQATDLARQNTGRVGLAALHLLAEWAEDASVLTVAARLRLQTALTAATEEQMIGVESIARSRNLRELRSAMSFSDHVLWDDVDTGVLMALQLKFRGLKSDAIPVGGQIIRDVLSAPRSDSGVAPNRYRIEGVTEGLTPTESKSVAEVLASLGEHVSPAQWTTDQRIREIAISVFEHQPVGHLLDMK